METTLLVLFGLAIMFWVRYGLMVKYRSMGTNNQANAELTEQLELIGKECADLKSQYGEMNTKFLEIDAINSDLNYDNSALKTKLDEAQKTNDALRSDLKKLTASINLLADEKNDALHRGDSLELELEGRTQLNAVVSKTCRSLEEKIKEITDNKSRLENDLSRSEATVAALEVRVADTLEDRKRIETLSETIQVLENEIATLANMLSDREEEKTQLKKSIIKLEASKERLTSYWDDKLLEMMDSLRDVQECIKEEKSKKTNQGCVGGAKGVDAILGVAGPDLFNR